MSPRVDIVATCGNRLGEAPLWLAEQQAVLWIDLPTTSLWRHDVASGATAAQALDLPAPLGAIVRSDDDATLLVSHRHGIARLDLRRLAIQPFADPEGGRDAVMYNDAKADRAGRLWAGTSHVAESEARGCLWILDGAGHGQLADAGFAVANGPAFAPDGCTAYVSDSAARQVLAYDLDRPDAAPRNRRLFCRFAEADGLPDGLTVDAEGCLWIAHWAGGRISRWSPQGAKLAEIAIPSHHVTSLCFAGDDLATLYVTSAWDGLDATGRAAAPRSGHLFRVRPGVTGLAEPRVKLLHR